MVCDKNLDCFPGHITFPLNFIIYPNISQWKVYPKPNWVWTESSFPNSTETGRSGPLSPHPNKISQWLEFKGPSFMQYHVSIVDHLIGTRCEPW